MSWYVGIVVVEIALALAVAGHALMYKRDTRAATFWLLLIIFVPWLGMVFYFIFGINRIRRDAAELTGLPLEERADGTEWSINSLLSSYRGCTGLDILQDGDEAYPKMLASIESAKQEVMLSTYIFDDDRVGDQFVEALQRAHARQVIVKILVDGVGMLYSRPPITRKLKQAGVPVAVFLPTFRPWSTRFLNLRNHRKLLIVDRQRAFLGGMNIREGHMLSLAPGHPVHDVHFAIVGPIVDDLVRQFASDWAFATKGRFRRRGTREVPSAPDRPDLVNSDIKARVVADGPDLSIPRLASLFMVKLAEAKSRVRIVTPYFLPDRVFVSALTTAALRGVEVEVIVPAKNNLPWMQWAMHALAWQLLEYGIRIHETVGEFDHSKIFLVDDDCAIVGSSNWDSRSFRLNFELNLEVQSSDFARALHALIDTRVEKSHRLTLAQLSRRSFAKKLRDGIARTFLPVL